MSDSNEHNKDRHPSPQTETWSDRFAKQSQEAGSFVSLREEPGQIPQSDSGNKQSKELPSTWDEVFARRKAADMGSDLSFGRDDRAEIWVRNNVDTEVAIKEMENRRDFYESVGKVFEAFHELKTDRKPDSQQNFHKAASGFITVIGGILLAYGISKTKQMFEAALEWCLSRDKDQDPKHNAEQSSHNDAQKAQNREASQESQQKPNQKF